jgi:hypothetical protein
MATENLDITELKNLCPPMSQIRFCFEDTLWAMLPPFIKSACYVAKKFTPCVS